MKTRHLALLCMLLVGLLLGCHTQPTRKSIQALELKYTISEITNRTWKAEGGQHVSYARQTSFIPKNTKLPEILAVEYSNQKATNETACVDFYARIRTKDD